MSEKDDAYINEKDDTRYQIQNINDRDVPEDIVDYQFTFRSIAVGTLLGCILGASNIYMGLKAGWQFLGSFFGSIAGFGIVQLISHLPLYLGGGPLGVRETCTIQTAATATAGLTAVFSSVIPAAYRLGLLPPLHLSWGLLICWLIPASFYGMFFAIPLRTTFVLKQKLPFPGPAAVSQVIKNLHKKSSSNASKQLWYMMVPFAGSLLYRVFTFFVPFLWDLHFFYWVGSAANNASVIAVDTIWGWRAQVTPAFFGCGMMVGLNTSFSFLAGALLAWGIIGPCVFYLTDIVGKSLVITQNPTGTSIVQWNLWIGIIMMLAYSFTELIVNYDTVFTGLKGPLISLKNCYYRRFSPSNVQDIEYEDHDDPAPPNEQVPTWMWVVGLITSLVVNILVNHFYLDIGIGKTILCAILSFLLSYVGTLIAAQTNINSGGAISKIVQIIFSVIPSADVNMALSSSLMLTGYSTQTILQASEMVGDLKTGHDVGAAPKYQFYAQVLATIPGIFVAVAIFQLFAAGYPCILSKTPDLLCPFPAPGAASFQSLALLLTSGADKLFPSSCRIACIVMGCVSIIGALLKSKFLKKYSNYIPNFGVIGLAFCVPQPAVPITLSVGAIFGYFWNKRNPESHSLLMMSIAAGMIGGEGIGGLVTAILTIAGVDQGKYAVGFGCPENNPKKC
ncbi:OPT superfamily oligopeptide transporter [Neoconidiobolus thromboides FSU 785]|nr:OPT superfamily oligopeptide transporter [Neoconidiobolus thromboides FSU 785]